MNELGITILRFRDYHVLKKMDTVLRAIEQYIVDFESNK